MTLTDVTRTKLKSKEEIDRELAAALGQGSFQRLVRWIRQCLCKHGCYLNQIRKTPTGVECPCIRCGKMITGKYGLVLECEWIKIPPNGELSDRASKT